jgi:hypothetical protein
MADWLAQCELHNRGNPVFLADLYKSSAISVAARFRHAHYTSAVLHLPVRGPAWAFLIGTSHGITAFYLNFRLER